MKKGFFAILAVLMVLAMVTTGCDNGSSPSKKDDVTLSSVTADGSTTSTTTQLTLTFSAAVTGLSAADITLSGVTGVTKGTLGGTGPVYTLPISGFTASGTLSVAVAKTGYNISGSPKTAAIFYFAGNPGDIQVTLNSVTANGTATETTTELTLTFDKAITGLSAADITLSGVTGVTKGTLGGTAPAYKLPISGFTVGGELSVDVVTKTGYNISGKPKTVTIYYASSTPGTYTITFNKNNPAYAPNGTAADPATKDVVSPATTVGTLPTDPTYDSAWAAGVTFDGWKNSSGAAFTKDTNVTSNLTVNAQWKFTAGTAQTVDGKLVVTGPEMVESPASVATWTGTINADGSVTYISGGFNVVFPTGYDAYDFVDVDWVYTNSNAGQPSDMIFKQGATSNDYQTSAGANSQYWKPDANTVSGTASRKFPVSSTATGIGLQIYWADSVPEADRFNVTIKITKLTFSNAPKHNISFNTDGGNTISPIEITEGKPFTLPNPIKAGYYFVKWVNTDGKKITNKSEITTDIELKAIWKTPAVGTSDIPITFSASDTVAIPMGAAQVDYVANGYTLTYGSNDGHQASQVKFAITLPDGASLADYVSITATINGTTGGGLVRWKDVGLLAGTPLPDSWDVMPLNGEYLATSGTQQYQQNATSMTFAIAQNFDLTGTVEFCIYTPADASDTGAARVFTVTNVKLNARVPAAPPLTIDLSTAAENVGGTPKTSTATSGNYDGISFKLIDQFPASGYSIKNYNRVTIVTECYSDEGTTPATGNSLYSVTLFRPWNGSSASGGYGGDGDGSFPPYSGTGSEGRLQATTAGANSHGPSGLDINITTTTNPEGIRFERNGSGSALRNIKIVSIKFWHTDNP
jgi:hypothetical protein